MPISRNKLVPGEYYIVSSWDKVDIKIFQYSHYNSYKEFIYGYNVMVVLKYNKFISPVGDNLITRFVMTYEHHRVIIPNLRKATQKEILQYYNITYNIKTTLL